MRRLKISSRIVMLVIIQLIALAAVGAVGVVALDRSSDSLQRAQTDASDLKLVVEVSNDVRGGLVDTIYALNAGTIDWATAKTRVDSVREALSKHFSAMVDSDDGRSLNLFGSGITSNVEAILTEVSPLIDARERGLLTLFVTNELPDLVEPVFSGIVAKTSAANEKVAAEAAAGLAANDQLFLYLIIALVAAVAIAAALGIAVFRSIAGPVGQISHTVEQIAGGDTSARANQKGNDEMAQLGNAFDSLLDDRMEQLRGVEEQNDQLNDSVITLLGAVAQLSQKDLRVRVPVTEDVTGPVADALNLLTDETARVLNDVRDVADAVAVTSLEVKTQSDNVVSVSGDEREKVTQAAAELARTSSTMRQIAEMAESCNQAADLAVETTQTAQSSVSDTVGGITTIRDTIRETEKRIKRLGERSQEISGAVSLINSIAERTHILALNASMHAASAGEAGRGFAVVADEVQRLAENAREATQQISGLVQNIQVETSDTVHTMNDAIAQVVEGTQLAEAAGSKMRDTRERTSELVSMVQRITEESRRQADATQALVDRAQEIVQSSEQTNRELGEQRSKTDQLVGFSERLVEAVGVFRLPGADDGSGTEATRVGGVTQAA